MKLIYLAQDRKDLKFLADSDGIQQIVAIIQSESDYGVLFIDTITGKSYIEKTSARDSTLKSSNLQTITDEQEFEMYLNAFKEYGILPEHY